VLCQLVKAQAALVKDAPFKATWTRVTKAPAGASCVSQMMFDEPPYLLQAPMIMTPASITALLCIAKKSRLRGQ